MEEGSTCAEIAGDYMRVPWPSWEHWDLVRRSLFSSSPQFVAAALDRIRAWRSRGSLPVAVEVTASIVEIQQKDTFFCKDQAGVAVCSDEMLSMLYSMAITRLVNHFAEKVHGFDNHVQKHALKKDKQSISKLADAVGVPRMLVDIRHESSHSGLPSLPLLRIAISKALDWLKHVYWEPQNRAIPNARKEVKCRLQQMVFQMKNKCSEGSKSSSVKGRRTKQYGPFYVCCRLSSRITGKHLSSKYDGPQKQMSRMLKVIVHLYTAYPTEVISSLLEFYLSQAAHNLHSSIDIQDMSIFNNGNLELDGVSENDIKSIIIKLSRKSPALLLRLLKEVLDMIESNETKQFYQGDICTKSLDEADNQQMETLSSLVPWLLVGLRDLKYSGLIDTVNDVKGPVVGVNLIPKVSLMKLLRRCVLLSAYGNKHLSISALFLAKMVNDESLFEKLRMLLLCSSSDKYCTAKVCDLDWKYDRSLEERDFYNAKIKFDALKSGLKDSHIKDIRMQNENENGKAKKMWTLAKGWNPCPIGMLPCSFSSAAYLPVLDKGRDSEEREELESTDGKKIEVSLPKKRESSDSALLENPSVQKKQREMPNDIALDFNDTCSTSPMKGMLLIDGVWRKVGEELNSFSLISGHLQNYT